MEKRAFLKKGSLKAAGAIVAPYIHPSSGKLCAAFSNRKVNHVVFFMLAGGLRNIDSVHQAENNLIGTMLKDVGDTYSEKTRFLQASEISANPLGNRRLQEYSSLLK